MPNRLFIDGVDVTHDVCNINEFVLEYKEDTDTKVVGEQISKGLIIGGESAKKIQEDYFENCDGFDRITPAKFTSDICGGFEIDVFVSVLDIEDDPCNCEVSVPFESISEERCCFQELNATEWYSGTEDNFGEWCENYDFPMVAYCNRPSFLQFIIFFISIPIRMIISILSVIAQIIENIIQLLPGLNDDNFDIDPFEDILRLFDEWISGCNRYMPSPYLRDVFEYQAAKCGLEFKSSIWQEPASPYYNEVVFCAESGQYLRRDDLEDQEAICRVFLANAPNISTIDKLKALAPKYNAKCKIINGKLCFETEEYFDQLGTDDPIFNLIELCEEGCIADSDRPKYKYKEEDLVSGVRITYCRDSLEEQGNKLMATRILEDGETEGKYKYNYSFNVNSDSDICKYSPHLLSAKTNEIQYGAALFMNDCHSGGGFFHILADAWISGNIGGAFGGVFNLFNYFGEGRSHDLIMSGDSSQYCKLLILEDGTDLKDAQVKKTPSTYVRKRAFGGDKVVNCWEYQADQWVDILHDNFHYYLDPRFRKGRLTVDKVVIPCDCDMINALREKKTQLSFITHRGLAKAEKYEIDFNESDSTITISDITVFCG